jgi:organic radical activating enzyme
MLNPLTHPNYCPLLYKSLHVAEDNTHISAGHCCISPMVIRTTTLDFYNDKFLVDSRNNWPTTQIDSCKTCWDNEAQNYPSYRQHNIEWSKALGSDPTTAELLRLDYSVGKLCNAKCIICGPHASTTWMAEDYKFSKVKQTFKIFENPSNSLVQHLDLSKLQILYLIGGEPLMSMTPVELLKKIQEQGNISNLVCQLSTNGSIKPSAELVNYWKKCKGVQIFASIDAIGSAFEYIRNPLDWQEVEDNLDYMLSIGPNIQVDISLVLGLHNIDELENTYLWYKSKKWNSQQTQFTIAPCNGTYAFTNATNKLLAIWKDKISKMTYPWKDQVLNLLSIPGNIDNNKWMLHLKKMDIRRNIIWSDHLPNLYKVYQSIDA